MPKGKKNKGKFEHRRTEQAYSSDEDAGIDMTIDNCSETSGQSDLKSIQDEADTEAQEKFEEKVMEVIDALSARAGALVSLGSELRDQQRIARYTEAQEKFEEKVMEVIDALSARAAAARAGALVSLRSALQRRPLAALLGPQRATLADHVTRALRRGREPERRAAAHLAPLLALQIGEDGSEEFLREVRPALAAAAVDKSASNETRAECCSALAVICYMLEEDLTEILEVLRMYETIFSGSYLKGDGSVKVSGAVLEEGLLHAAALDGWALLMTVPSSEHAAALLRSQPPSFARLGELLEACTLEVRMAAGTALAVAHERVTDGEEAGEGDEAAHVAALLPALQQLARDSHKFRAKRHRKLQRATFRDIYKYFEEDEVPRLSVRIGAETLSCDTWAAVTAYGALAGALGAGLQTLAPHSSALRAALGLGEPPALQPPTHKLNKLQRHLQNNAACKARTISRNKNRDKRSAALAL